MPASMSTLSTNATGNDSQTSDQNSWLSLGPVWLKPDGNTKNASPTPINQEVALAVTTASAAIALDVSGLSYNQMIDVSTIRTRAMRRGENACAKYGAANAGKMTFAATGRDTRQATRIAMNFTCVLTP